MSEFDDLSMEEINDLYDSIVEFPENKQMIAAYCCSMCWATFNKYVDESAED